MQNNPADKEIRNLTDALSEMNEAKERLKLPAIGIIVSAGTQLASFLILFLYISIQRPVNSTDARVQEFFKNLMPVFVIILFSLYGFSVYGALQMMQVKNYRSAMASAIIHISTLICGFPLVGVPVGIWALVVLQKSEIKSAFARNAAT